MSKASKIQELKHLVNKPIAEIPESKLISAIKVILYDCLSPDGIDEISNMIHDIKSKKQ